MTGVPSIGQVVSLRGYAKDARSSLDGVLDLYTNSKTSQGATKRILSYLRREPGAKDKPGAPDFRRGAGAVSFRDVRYSSGGEELLAGASFDAAPGESLVVMGGRPAARRALVDLLLRLDGAGKGTVGVDGQDVAEVTRASLQESVALVQNDPIIFPSISLRENLTFGLAGKVSDEELAESLRAAGAESFLDPARFPEGLDTELDPGGLTDAQKQRLSLARAALRDSSILIVDGAGAGLDPRAADEVRRAVQKLSRGRTTLMLNVPASWVRDADRVLLAWNLQLARGPRRKMPRTVRREIPRAYP